MRVRSVLFAPATRPELVAKLARCRPDVGVVDLEDAVPPDAKDAGRESALAALDALARDGAPAPALFVRVNPVDSPWWEQDAALAAHPAVAGVVAPKLERAEQLDRLMKRLIAVGAREPRVIAGVETARGVLDVRCLLRWPVAAVYFGAEDLIADVGGRRTPGGEEVLYARSRVALAARVAGVPAIDQVVVALDDEAGFAADAARGASLGYRGKLCIHPRQVAWAHAAFAPSEEEVARARSLLAACEAAAREGAGAIAFEGAMVDAPMLAHARRVLADAEETPAEAAA